MSQQDKNLLQVRNLKTWFGSDTAPAKAVDGISFDINPGETFALLGESGCGKSVSSLSILRLVPEPAGKIVGGQILLHGQDLLQLPEQRMRDVRGRRISMIFQEPMTSLNPVLTIGRQIEETILRHGTLAGSASAKSRTIELLDAVGIPDPQRRYEEYPHQLSGGMKQRVMIAIALAGEPELLIADEPTTALDVTIQAQVLGLLRELQRKTHMAILLITHDLGVVAEMADRVAVMYAGQIVEQSDREQFFREPRHPYSQKLFDSVPNMEKRNASLAVIHGSVPPLTTKFSGCRFAPRCEQSLALCENTVPVWTGTVERDGVLCHLYTEAASKEKASVRAANTAGVAEKEVARQGQNEPVALLKLNELKVHFPIHKGLLQRTAGFVKAVDDISLQIDAGRTLALVGESGCGKTTVGKGILQLLKPTAGEVWLEGDDMTRLSREALNRKRGDVQVIFQDPFSSMNPRMMVVDIIKEGMLAQGVGESDAWRDQRVDELLEQVGLRTDAKHRYPHEFSGGQRQRICIARALAVEPKLIICDEPTSALDVSVQAQILNLLKDLQDRYGLAYLFITHNLSVVEYLAHEVAVMYLGRIVEFGKVDQVMRNPCHPYTKALLSAVPRMEPDLERPVIKLSGEMPSPANPPQGCHFHPRCSEKRPECLQSYPNATAVEPGHDVRCVLFS